MGMPASGPTSSPAAIRRSMSAAWARAASKSTATNALSDVVHRLDPAIAASVSSRADSWRAATLAASPARVSLRKSIGRSPDRRRNRPPASTGPRPPSPLEDVLVDQVAAQAGDVVVPPSRAWRSPAARCSGGRARTPAPGSRGRSAACPGRRDRRQPAVADEGPQHPGGVLGRVERGGVLVGSGPRSRPGGTAPRPASAVRRRPRIDQAGVDQPGQGPADLRGRRVRSPS